MRQIATCALVMVLAVAALGQGTDADRLRELEGKIAGLEARMATQETLSKLHEAALTKRLDELEAQNARALGRLAEIAGEDPAQVGTLYPESLKPCVDALNERAEKQSTQRGRVAALDQIAAAKRDGIGCVPTVIASLQEDTDRMVRRQAARTLGAICAGGKGALTRQALAALKKAKGSDADEGVKTAAGEAIKGILN